MDHLLTQIGVTEKLGAPQIFKAEEKWFEAFQGALKHAESLVASEKARCHADLVWLGKASCWYRRPLENSDESA